MSDGSCFHNLQEGGILRQLAPGITARIFPGVNVMLSVVTIEPHSTSPVHSHPNEQWGVCLEGEWIRIQDGKEHHVRAGDFWQTPPNLPHGGRTLDQRCVVLDIFAPPREEYRQAGKGYGTASSAGRRSFRADAANPKYPNDVPFPTRDIRPALNNVFFGNSKIRNPKSAIRNWSPIPPASA